MTQHMHLDSRRLLPEGEDKSWNDYSISLDDTEAVEVSPFKEAYQALGRLGLTQVLIEHAHSGEDVDEWWYVAGIKKFEGTEPLVSDWLGGNIEVKAAIGETGERGLYVSFGGDYTDLAPEDLNEMVWGYLEVIYGAVTKGFVGEALPALLMNVKLKS